MHQSFDVNQGVVESALQLESRLLIVVEENFCLSQHLDLIHGRLSFVNLFLDLGDQLRFI